MAVDTDSFKEILSKWVSGVTVATTIDGEDWKGTTVSSFNSVSLSPPLVLICLDKSLYTHQLITNSKVFAVNILSESQVEIGKIFAGMYPDIENRFEGLNCMTSVTGSPILPNILGWLDCKVAHAYDGGDHTIFVGEVVAGSTQVDSLPLAYSKRQWGRFEPFDPA